MELTEKSFYEIALSKGLKPQSDYINRNTKMSFKCMLCGKNIEVTPRSVLTKTKTGCRSCAGKMSEQTFRTRVYKLNPNIDIVSEYIDSKTNVQCKCKICENIWERKPNDILNGHNKCPKCFGYYRMNNDEFYQQFNIHGDSDRIILRSSFVNHRTPILCECKLDGYQWKAYPYDILNKRCGCRRCNRNETYTTKEFKEIMFKINPDICVLGKYINSSTKIKCQCRKCLHIWYPTPDNLKTGHTRCPICFANKSKGEDVIEKYLNTHNIIYEKYKKFDDLKGVGNRSLSYDFYLPQYNFLFEYQGKQHVKPIEYFGGEKYFQIQQEHDKRKRNYAVNNGYRYYEFWYDEIKNIPHILNKIL